MERGSGSFAACRRRASGLAGPGRAESCAEADGAGGELVGACRRRASGLAGLGRAESPAGGRTRGGVAAVRLSRRVLVGLIRVLEPTEWGAVLVAVARLAARSSCRAWPGLSRVSRSRPRERGRGFRGRGHCLACGPLNLWAARTGG